MSQIDRATGTVSFDDVRTVIITALGIEPERAKTFSRETELLGGFAEFDSMAVLEVVAAIEAAFDITVDDDDISAEMFETLGSLADYVQRSAS